MCLDKYLLCLDTVLNDLRGQCIAEGLSYHRSCPVQLRRRSIRRRRKKIVPLMTGLLSKNKKLNDTC